MQRECKPKEAQAESRRGEGCFCTCFQTMAEVQGWQEGQQSKTKGAATYLQLGGTAANPEGDPVCLGFNSEGGCSGAADGARCSWGSHVCQVPPWKLTWQHGLGS